MEFKIMELTEELKIKIKEKFTLYKDKYKKLTKLIQQDQQIYEFCIKTLKKFPQYQEIKYIVKCICNDVDLVHCKVCGKILTYHDSVKSKFKGLYCGKQCQYKDQEYLNKLDSIGVKKAFKEKIGYQNPFSLPEVKEKIKQTNLKKYGVENPAQSPEIIKKIQQTKLKNCTNTGSKYVQQKMKHTSLEKYGVQFYAQTQQCKQKLKQKCQQQYGYDYYSQVPEIKEKIKQTCKAKFGSEYYLTSQDYKKKNFNTAMQKYNAPTYLASEKHKQEILDIGWQTILSYKNYIIPLFSRQQYIGYQYNKIYHWKCMLCSSEFEQKIYNTNHIPEFSYCPRCLKCFPYLSQKSNKEIQLINFCKQYFPQLTENTTEIITPKELDIYIPQIKLALEFNGSYWHNIYQVPQNYHLNKSIDCQNLGIRLIHIWEDEWNNNKQQIKQKLINIFTNNEIIDYSKPLDRSWYGKFPINGYQLIQETKPEIIIRDKQQVENCGYLIYKKIEK